MEQAENILDMLNKVKEQREASELVRMAYVTKGLEVTDQTERDLDEILTNIFGR